MKYPKKSLSATFLVAIGILPVSTFPQTGGPFDLSHTVIASGGGSNSIGGTFNVSGTAGQQIAGTASNSHPSTFDLHGGFWYQNLTPTAANVAVSGRVFSVSGQGLKNATVVLHFANGRVLNTRTGPFGFFRFDQIESGQTVIVSVMSKLYQFDTRVITIAEEITDLDFSPMTGSSPLPRL